ncbi:MAG TPA: PIG-L family deacetylase [Anaeromyxobacteraceae bacterium]|nr:PIG-L family deacetylase [Anaeromyxobacteraceae bacterium]
MSVVVLGGARAGSPATASGRPPVAIVAAHPDDETIGASALLLRSPGAAVIHLTDGAPRDRAFWTVKTDASRDEYATRRRLELRRAMRIAGVPEERQLRLAAVDQEAALALVPLARALAELLVDLRPRRIVTHAYEGGHPDHDAAAFVARGAIALLRQSGAEAPRLFEMTSYHASSGGALATCEYLDARAGPVHTRVLSAVERRAKDEMLAAYESQRDVIAWFPRELERLRRAPRCDFGRPPHEGVLWYERMGFPIDGARWRELARDASTRLERERLEPRGRGVGA